MLDEEGYAVLALRQKTAKAAAPDSAMDFHRYRIGVGVLGALNVLLLVAVAVLGAWVLQGSVQEDQAGAAGNATLEELLRRLRRRLCASDLGAAAEGSRCELCPRGWLPFRDWCYWVSEEVKCWRDGCSDCRTKKSRMLVIRDQEEMEFIRNVTQETSLVWIGLSVKSSKSDWTWVDGSVLNHKLFRVKGNAENNSCGVIRKRQINSESCNAEFKWICQTEAILL